MNTQQIMRYIFVKIRSFSIFSCVIKIKSVMNVEKKKIVCTLEMLRLFVFLVWKCIEI